MLRSSWIPLVAVALTAGCSQSVKINPAPAVPVATRWNATLATPQSLAGVVQVHGSAWMAPANATDSSRTVVYVSITNATPGGLHPWAIHLGQCGSDQGVLGPPNAYPPLRVGNDGTANARITLSIPLPSSGDYYANISASSANINTVLACGNLAAPSR